MTISDICIVELHKCFGSMAGEWVTETGGKVEPGLQLWGVGCNTMLTSQTILLELCSIPEVALSESLQQTRGSRVKHELIMTSESS